MIFKKFYRRAIGSSDEGIALVMVLAIFAVLTMLISAGFVYALGSNEKSKTDENWNSALAAAYAGVEEYQSRLAEDTTYLKYGNPSSTFKNGGTVTLPATTNAAFGLGTTGTWANVAGSGGTAQFRYEVDNSKYSKTGTLRLRSTGKVGDQSRTIVSELRQQGFVDFLYFTDYEIQDPAITGKASTCVTYAWAGRATSSTNACGEIAFGGGDVVSGPAHSNDTLRVCDARFKGEVTTGYNPTTGIRYSNKDSNGNTCTGQTFDLGTAYPKYSPVVAMPATNTQLKRETRSDLTTSDVPLPGCLYTGPTSITLRDDGQITVKSPWTKATRVQGDPATAGTAPDVCGKIADLKSAAGATFYPPENNVLYIQNVPATTSDPNYWASTAQPNTSSCLGATPTSGTTPAGNGLGYPVAGEAVPTTDSYKCRNGDLFISGTLDGTMTIAAENYIYVVGDVKYEAANDDMLGLVGNNAVFVWNPVTALTSTGTSLLPTAIRTNRRIDAAILSVAHSFAVQTPVAGGDRGTLTVNGAIAAKFRGVVKNGNGYVKNYVYDARLKYTAPPKFLSPVTTTYGVNVWVEVAAVMKSTGAYR